MSPSLRKKVQSIPYLADTLSSGPKEFPSLHKSEFTSYNSAELDVKLLLALTRKDPAIRKITCIPRFFASYSKRDMTDVTFSRSRLPNKHSVRAGILITHLGTSRPQLLLPEMIHTFVKDCEKRGIRFVVFNTGLYWAKGGDAHANAILFDTRHKVIERYEPSGSFGIIPHLSTAFSRFFPEWSFVDTAYMTRGVQNYSDSFDGMCVTFSLYYMLLRLTNPDETPAQVSKYMDKLSENGMMRSHVLRLNKYAATILKQLRRHELDNVRTRRMRSG